MSRSHLRCVRGWHASCQDVPQDGCVRGDLLPLENTNRCRSVRPNKRRQCERFPSAEELARFGEVLAELRASDNLTIRSGCAVITLLLLTGCRYRETLTLQWQDVKRNRLLLRDNKTGPRTVWLGSARRHARSSTVCRAIPKSHGCSGTTSIDGRSAASSASGG